MPVHVIGSFRVRRVPFGWEHSTCEQVADQLGLPQATVNVSARQPMHDVLYEDALADWRAGRDG